MTAELAIGGQVDVQCERTYLELVLHAQWCARCWPWRHALHRRESLCATGQTLVDLYAQVALAAAAADPDFVPSFSAGGRAPLRRGWAVPERWLAHIRILGEPAAVRHVAELLRQVLEVAEESADYPYRRGDGVRRYLTVLIAGED